MIKILENFHWLETGTNKQNSDTLKQCQKTIYHLVELLRVTNTSNLDLKHSRYVNKGDTSN